MNRTKDPMKAWRERNKDKIRAYGKKYRAKPEVKVRQREYQRAWYQRPEVRVRVRECQREYFRRPEVKARAREYYREYHREYFQRPGIKAHQREYQREYLRRPEVKARAEERRNEKGWKQREKNLRQFVENSKTASPDSLFSADKRVLAALALDGGLFDKEWEKRRIGRNKR